MDPFALAAVVGLAFVGKQMSDPPVEERVPETIKKVKNTDVPVFPDEDIRMLANRWPSKKEVGTFADVSQDSGGYVYGQPVYNLNNRENVSNMMRNLNPNPWVRVGPGIGVGPNVPSYGGYQQLAREMPVNVNEHRLTQLPGRPQAPPASMIPKQENPTLVSKNRPEKDFYRAPMQANGRLKAPEARGNYPRLKFTTKKEQTERRGRETLGGPRYVLNSGYVVSGNQTMIRNLDNRSRPDRASNPGRMNVRADPMGANGAISSVRIDNNTQPVNHGRSQVPINYIRSGIQQVNPFKDIPNPNTRNLDLAKRQLENNIYNHPLSAA